MKSWGVCSIFRYFGSIFAANFFVNYGRLWKFSSENNIWQMVSVSWTSLARLGTRPVVLDSTLWFYSKTYLAVHSCRFHPCRFCARFTASLLRIKHSWDTCGNFAWSGRLYGWRYKHCKLISSHIRRVEPTIQFNIETKKASGIFFDILFGVNIYSSILILKC